MPQTSMTAAPAVALAGMYRSDPELVIDGVLASSAGINAGLFCKRVGLKSFAILAGAGDLVNLAGVVCRELIKVPSTPDFAQYAVIAVVRRGFIYVPSVGTTTDEQIPFIVHTGANLGKVSVDAAGGDAAQVNGIRIVKGAANGALALVEVNLPPALIVVDT